LRSASGKVKRACRRPCQVRFIDPFLMLAGWFCKKASLALVLQKRNTISWL
jgi:hypothetical protein